MSMLLVITGASRGLGKAIALEFCAGNHHHNNNNKNHNNRPESLDMILISRNEQLLRQTKLEIQQQQQQQQTNKSNVILCILDLGDLKDLEARVEAQIINAMDKLVLQQQRKQYDHFVFINNAGSLGHIGPSIQTPSLAHMQQHVDLNVTAACWLSARMAKWAKEDKQTTTTMRTIATTTIVNISSLVAVQAFPSMALYSAGKAARDQYHVAMAKEELLSQTTTTTSSSSGSSSSNIRILNYAPGPLETDMTNEIRQAQELDAELKPHYKKKLIEPRDSAARLAKLVRDNSFENGQHIDYYDLDG